MTNPLSGDIREILKASRAMRTAPTAATSPTNSSPTIPQSLNATATMANPLPGRNIAGIGRLSRSLTTAPAPTAASSSATKTSSTTANPLTGLDLAGKSRMGESLSTHPVPTPAGGITTDSSPTVDLPSPPEPPVAMEDPELPVPEIIPFLQPRQTSKSGYKNRWSDEQFRQAYRQAQKLEVDNSTDLPEEATEWTTAEETHYTDKLYSKHPEGDWKGLVDCIEFRWGKIEEGQIFQILKDIPSVNGSNHKEFRQRLIRRANGAKNGTTWFFMLSMEHLAEIVPGFATATRRQRRSLVGRIFSLAPVTISRNAFSSDKESVSFENIFRSGADPRKRWQSFTKTKFVELALDAYEYRVLNGDSREGTESFTSSYLRHSLKNCYKELELGGSRNVPTKGEYDRAAKKTLKRKRNDARS